jgi:hypothetical protein
LSSFARLDVPQPAQSGEIVGDDDPHHVVFPQPPAFHLEIDWRMPTPNTPEGNVDADGERHDTVSTGASPSQTR